MKERSRAQNTSEMITYRRTEHYTTSFTVQATPGWGISCSCSTATAFPPCSSAATPSGSLLCGGRNMCWTSRQPIMGLDPVWYWSPLQNETNKRVWCVNYSTVMCMSKTGGLGTNPGLHVNKLQLHVWCLQDSNCHSIRKTGHTPYK